MDKLADKFITSLLYKGKLNTLQANSLNEDIRLIKPFLYVRERILDDFAIHDKLPSRPSKILTRPPDTANSILKVQEAINPNVYVNIRNALKPLMSKRLISFEI